METKICKKCGIEKEYCEFDKDIRKKDGIRSKCKSCRREYINNYNEKNRDKYRKYRKIYYWENREKELIRSREKHERNKEKEIEYRQKNREKKAKKEKEKYQNDNLYKLKINLRNRLKLFLKSKKINKQNKTFEIVGEHPEIVKKHIENQFKDGMSWENYGHSGWHIDHIIP
jgi:hypothetical protein